MNNLGFNVVPSGTIIKVTLYLTNPFSGYSFTNRSISVASINYDNQEDSVGVIQLASVYLG